MTVSYTGDVANGSSFGCFWKILGRWKGSVYKLIWRELIAYLMLYFAINIIYRQGMNNDQRRTFEKVKVYCSKQIESIPMSFVLGFYVSLIVKRWWDQYWILPMPDSLALYISASIHGQDEKGRILRRTIMRYTLLSYIITLQRISFRVKKRFPTLQHLVDAHFMYENEKKIFDQMDAKAKVSKFWMPVVWASNLINRARQEGRIHSDHMVQTILTELSDFRRRLGRVMVYDNVSVPLVYTQVVTLAVYTYFLAALIGRQWVKPEKDADATRVYPGYEMDLYFPIFLSLQFIFYIGWLKVAETLINPFGEDDDDFDMNWLIDRHLTVSYMVVDEMHEAHPDMLKDHYWDEVVPGALPYNQASAQFKRTEPQGSTASMKIKSTESVYDNLTSVKRHSAVPDEVYAEYESVNDTPLVQDRNRKSWLQRTLSRMDSLRSTYSSSGIFSRNRNPIPGNSYPASGVPGPRSLHERMMNRRSSKDTRNSPRLPPPVHPRTFNGAVVSTKESMSTLMPQPQSRPRVPTPDVAKENQVNLMSSRPGDAARLPYNAGGSYPVIGIMNHAYSTNGRTSTPTSSDYAGDSVEQNGMNYLNYATGTTSPSSKGNSPPPPPYDSNDHAILSPIAENDGSPYSTSSTARSVKSSNYPTTTSIFGARKPSPPPPQEELPPIPVTFLAMSPLFTAKDGPGIPRAPSPSKFLTTRRIDDELPNPAVIIQDVDNSLLCREQSDNEDMEETYMTISDVNQAMKSIPGGFDQESKKGKGRRKNDDGTLGGGVRKISLMQRQNAIFVPSDDDDKKSTEGERIIIRETALLADNDDDGYDERGSYNDEDGGSGRSIETTASLHDDPTVTSGNPDLTLLAAQFLGESSNNHKSTDTSDIDIIAGLLSDEADGIRRFERPGIMRQSEVKQASSKNVDSEYDSESMSPNDKQTCTNTTSGSDVKKDCEVFV